MSMLGSDWRDGPAYDYFDELTPEQTAFEFLRRDEDYVTAYEAVAHQVAPDDNTGAAFSARWGLRFPGRSRAPGRPDADHLAAPA